MAFARENPEVAVLARLSFSQMGSVTYLATKECLDLISGKGSDILMDNKVQKWDINLTEADDWLIDHCK